MSAAPADAEESTEEFTGRTALVTGGGRNIGRAIALAFARRGASVVVAGRSEGPLKETVRLIEAGGGTASAVTADVTRPEDARRMVAEAAERHGGLHIAVNNAGVVGTPGVPLGDLDDEVWADVLAVNTTGVWLSMKHEIARMRADGGGAIINVGSRIGAHQRLAGMGAYGASKAAVSTLTRTAAREYIGDGVRINALSPGASDTEMSFRPGETVADRAARVAGSVPIGRVAATDEIAEAAVWLASDRASFVVGHDLVVDGGATA
ncbi:glucose 1-dehydrogenase [Nocardiopsis sp. RSe5-2]|uniref:Glucose 1-dehydrogenase n=1 Tax=Nocardiopsis endophytica TaxID=3018445 RepID=A0ABT4U9K1_9ACTN|nr:glucose 1-dehydrogenase [Nocardiopsis endophytica]MDA2813644.1 glucose 1-dehydrogenase [Nocardiopsis endophytica]